MKLSIEPGTAPLTTGQDSVVRIGKSRVTLDTVVYAFNDGANAEEILERYPSLQLADIYSVIAFYLRHRTEVDTYLKDREAFRVEVRRENESRLPSTGLLSSAG
ncbi:MAG: hypothetical protein DMG17_26380 [Acidobacteria bacterium]|nr:MAG: hypothetical protein DMG17_26380 [Acidobacteriota bacterium]